MTTIWKALKDNWRINKCEIRDLGINPDNCAGTITFSEICRLAQHLDVTASELIENYYY